MQAPNEIEAGLTRAERKDLVHENPLLFSALAFVALAARGATPESSASQIAENEIRHVCAEEVNAFLKNDRSTMARLWSDDFVVTNPLNELVTKQQVLGTVDSGLSRHYSF